MPDPGVTSQIGPYRTLETLGEGGMGIVHLAEQREPVRRRVAVKVIKLGMDSKAVLARFEAERRALSLMQHPCIATVLDAGVTAQGQPYFVMEYVKGIPITDYCDQNRVGLTHRIELLQQVCSGVQHAHSKGVMHRDLKPGNVLVTVQDGKPVPKIIDFGLAKATDHHLIEATLFTEQGAILGTPEYMSPEQAGLGGLDVDTRTDVYSLGVLLYELLVGQLPFTRRQLREAGLLEMQRLIREQEPTRPSTKVTTLGDAAGAVAHARRTSTRELGRRLRGDLDWIVLKTLEKDRTRRYETPQELATDLARHLGFEPVHASPPSVGYRLRKFVRRYRVQCAAIAIVLAAVGTGSYSTWRQYERAEANYLDMVREASLRGTAERQARERAQELAKVLESERRLNERNLIFADAARLDAAIACEAALFPPLPEKVLAMREWLTTYAEPLEARHDVLEQALEDVEARALPASSHGERDIRSQLPQSLDILYLRAAIWMMDDRMWRLTSDSIANLETDVAAARFEFASLDDAFLHRTLVRVTGRLRTFCGKRGTVGRVRARLAAAETVQQRTIDAYRTQWDEAVAGIRAGDRYRGLAIAPQAGLVPLGQAPESQLWEFVHVASGAPGKEFPRRDLATGRLVPDGDMGIVFVLIPGGTLPVETGQQLGIRHKVALDAFFLSKYEMTEGQWQRLAGARGTDLLFPRTSELRMPASQISWFDCEAVLRQEGLELPSELQWEYGCRGGTRSPWWTGDAPDSLRGSENLSPDLQDVLPVGSLKPNRYGLFDIAGNVSEWCADSFFPYGSERRGDGRRTAASPGIAIKFWRGGSAGGEFPNRAATAMSGFRDDNLDTGQTGSLGYGSVGLRPTRSVR